MAKIVNFSEAASLAIHAMVLIAKSEKSDKYINVNHLSERMGASRNHLAKIMQQLVKFGYLKSVRGPKGGFVLNKPASEISILDIYEAIEGRIDIHSCPLDRPICPFDKCLMSGVIKDITSQFKDYIGNHTLEDFTQN
ncbi:MAG: RrF2 family transcriptional regulator [Bacteroidota bacterium]